VILGHGSRAGGAQRKTQTEDSQSRHLSPSPARSSCPRLLPHAETTGSPSKVPFLSLFKTNRDKSQPLVTRPQHSVFIVLLLPSSGQLCHWKLGSLPAWIGGRLDNQLCLLFWGFWRRIIKFNTIMSETILKSGIQNWN